VVHDSTVPEGGPHQHVAVKVQNEVHHLHPGAGVVLPRYDSHEHPVHAEAGPERRDRSTNTSGVQWRRPCQYEVVLSRPAAPQQLQLSDYSYKYDWLRPKLEEIVDTYMKLHGKESCDSDNESDGSNGTGGLKEEDGEEDGEGGVEED